MPLPSRMPDLITLAQHNGDWEKYLSALHAAFQADFVINDDLIFEGAPLRLKKHPIVFGKEATFWHIISGGPIEADREIDFRRCERVAWPAAMIRNCAEASVKIWREERNLETRVQLYCDDAQYLTVLAERDGYFLPWTAYPIEHTHQRRKLMKRWEDAQN